MANLIIEDASSKDQFHSHITAKDGEFILKFYLCAQEVDSPNKVEYC